MNIHSIFPLVVLVITILLGSFVFYKKKKLTPTTSSFLFIAGNLTIYLLFCVMMFSTDNKTTALFLARFGTTAVIFTPIACYQFIINFFELQRERRFLVLFYIFGVSLFFLTFTTNLLMKDVKLYCWGYFGLGGYGLMLTAIMCTILFIRTNSLLFVELKNKNSPEIKRRQARYLLAAVGVLSIAVVDFFPTCGFEVYPIGYLTMFAMLVIIAYAIVKHQLLEIEVVITRTTIFALVYGFTLGLPFIIFALFKEQIQVLHLTNSWTTPTILASYAALATITPFIYLKLERKAYYALFGDYSGQLQVLREKSREIISKSFDNTGDLARIIPTYLIDFYNNTMQQKVKHAFYLLREPGQFTLHHGQVQCDRHIEGMEISYENPIIKWFMNTREQLIQERIIKPGDKNRLNKEDIELWLQDIVNTDKSNIDKFNELRKELISLQKEINCLEGAIFIASSYRNELMGILAIGEKESGSYRPEELETFDVLAENAAMVLKVAHLTASVVEAEKIKAIEKAKSEFFSNVSHELRTPLTNIIPPVEMCLSQDGENLPLPVKNIFNGILLNSRKLLKEINNLLDISKLESGKMKLKCSLTDINSLLNIIIEPALELARARQIRILKEYAPDLESIYLDPEYISKTFSNLLNNALKFTLARGTIIIKTENDMDYIKILVSDTGVGIDEKDLPYIFDRFKQADSSISRQFEGTGIGLSLVKEIVALHHGRIEVKSAKDKGSTFTVRLPKGIDYLGKQHIDIIENMKVPKDQGQVVVERRKEERRENSGRREEDRREEDNTPEYGASLQYTDLMSSLEEKVEDIVPSSERETLADKHYKVLVIENNKDLATNLKNLLKSIYRVYITYNGKEGLEKIKQDPPDLIISDIMMPEMDGYTLCKILKTDPQTELIPVVLLTARATIEDKILGIEYGADKYITKPFNYRELLASISALIKQFELKQSLKGRNEKLEETLRELKETQGQLVHSAKLAAVGQLAAGVAHEVNNPACALDSSLALLGRKLDSIANQKIELKEALPTLTRSVKLAEEALTRIKKIVEALLNFSRKNREGFNIVNIHEGIESTLLLLESQYKHSITIHKDFGDITRIEADLQQLNQVFMNLINNAVFAIKSNQNKGFTTCGHIWIQTRQDNDQVEISIQDDGPGIPEDVLPRIFEPFYTTKDVGQGTGLGLSISYKVIENHNGIIKAENTENAGARFVIRLPVSQSKG